MIVYRRHDQPGCGGCLLLVCLLLLLVGGLPALFNFFGFLLFAFGLLVLSAIVAVWGFSWYVRRQVSRYEQSQSESHNLFVFLLVQILVRIAQLDGTVTRAESQAIADFFRVHLRYSHQQLLWVRELIKEAAASQATLDELLLEFRTRFGYEPRLILLELIYRVLFTNERVGREELATVERIADYLAISPYDHQAIRARYLARGRAAVDREAQWYETLGLAPGADWEQIKSAYRTLSKQYHPDKVNHLGEEFKRVAEEKMKEINEAYQYLKKKFQGTG